MARLHRRRTSEDKAMERNDDQGSFWAPVTTVLRLILVVGGLYLPLFL
jgi:hypothetical protein